MPRGESLLPHGIPMSHLFKLLSKDGRLASVFFQGRPLASAVLRFRVSLVSIALACAALLAVAAPAHGQPVDPIQVTVTVIRFIQDQRPDPADDGDFFAGVCWPDGFTSGSNTVTCNVRQPAASLVNHQTTGVLKDNTPDVTPFWTLTRTFDRAAQSTARFTLVMWDRDPSWNAPDDVMDINPVKDRVTLTFSVDLFTGDWLETSGSIPANTGFARGNGDAHSVPGWFGPGGEPGRVLFDISLSDDGDGDDDGIPDGLEHSAVRDGNGAVVAALAGRADPCRKTVLVEADFMEPAGVGQHSHRPKTAAINEVVAAFDNATSVPARPNCPYAPASNPPKPGVNLVVDVNDAVPEQPVLAPTTIGACATGLPAIRDTAGFFNPARRPYFHYSLWVHDLAPGVTNGGVQCRSTTDPGRDFIVSLGSWRTTCVLPGPNASLDTTAASDDVVVGNRIDNGPNRTCNSTAAMDDLQVTPVGTGQDDYQVGTVRDQSASFMHELGHALGLHHGGVEAITQDGNAAINFKPNYLSVMNYHFAATGIFDGTTFAARIDYSRNSLPPLDRSALNENVGIGDGNDLTAWFDPNGNRRFRRGNLPIDWNINGMFEANVSADINGSSRCISDGGNGLQTTAAAGSDDNTIGTTIFNGVDDACQTITAAANSLDTVQVETFRPCVATGGDDILTTSPSTGSDDVPGSMWIWVGPIRIYVPGSKWIGMGADRICNTTAATGDVQVTPPTKSEPTVPLRGSDDWSGLNYSDRLAGVGSPLAGAPPADITFEQAVELEAFWRDAATIPGVAVDAQAPLIGPVVARFTETVEAVTTDNLVLRRVGGPQPLPVTSTCKDPSGQVVSCASRAVAAAELRPGSPLVPGEQYQLGVNPAGVRPVTDLAGNSVAPTQLPLRGSLDESERSVAATYQWQPVSNANAAGGSYTREHLESATASFRFNGSSITWYTVTGPDQGLANVFIDGILVQTLNQYDTTTSYQVPRSFGGLSPGQHTITIEATGLKGQPTATDTFVSVDAFRVGEDLFDPPDVHYTWQPNRAFQDIAGIEYVWTDLGAAQVAFSFRGTGITLYTVEGPSSGRFTVLIDGQPAGVFDGYRSTPSYAVPVTFGGLTDRLHTLTVVVAGQARPASSGAFVAVDGWSVQ
jgi:hypothetical protein